jgi:hypothetical protein
MQIFCVVLISLTLLFYLYRIYFYTSLDVFRWWYSELLCCVAFWLYISVSEEQASSIFRSQVRRVGKWMGYIWLASLSDLILHLTPYKLTSCQSSSLQF